MGGKLHTICCKMYRDLFSLLKYSYKKTCICKNGFLCQVFVQSELNYKLFL